MSYLNRMVRLAFISIPTVFICASAQKTYVVDDFSKEFFGKVHVNDTCSVYCQGWVAIYCKKTGREMIRVNGDAIAFDLHEGKIRSNIAEFPYGRFSPILYQDFNFDGINDIAIQHNRESCYGLLSFSIYLSNGRTFYHSKEFTRLATEYCGMFEVDNNKKTLMTMMKSGYGYHKFTYFKVSKNIPCEYYSITETDDGPYSVFREDPIRSGSKIIGYKKKVIELNERSMEFAFTLPNGKTIVLYGVSSGTKIFDFYGQTSTKQLYSLVYECLDKNGAVEFTFTGTPKNPFWYNFIEDENKQTLTFKNHEYTYVIFCINDFEDVGIHIYRNGTKMQTLIVADKGECMFGGDCVYGGNLGNVSEGYMNVANRRFRR